MEIKSAGLPTIALHGFLGRPADFNFLNSKFKNLIVPDYFNSNELSLANENLWSQWPEQFWKFKAPGSLDELKKCQLIGYSLGGRLAVSAFSAHPERIEKLVLISAGVWPIDKENKEQRLQQDELWAQKFQNENWNTVLQQWNSQNVFAGSVHEPKRLERDYKKSVLAQVLRNWSPALMPNYLELLKKYQDRILFICGENDIKFRTKYEHLKSKGFIQNLQIIRNAGHRVLFDSPEPLLREIENFLAP